MGRQTVLTEPRKQQILEALRVGASRKTAAHIAGIGESTLRLNMSKGAAAAEDSPLRRFHDAVLAAEAHPRERALGIIYREMDNNPTLAWKFIERREDGYAPPMPTQALPQGPVVIELALSGGQPLALKAAEIVEGEIIADETTDAATPA